jgi:Rps23 Pro-64 3,4-dihydroxylase Tpa1-like proline 4-hydroxylase
VLTLICYLNEPCWFARQGGQLRVFSRSGAGVAEVLPAGGTVVALRSSVQHEVAPTSHTRMAVTCWLVGETTVARASVRIARQHVPRPAAHHTRWT